MSSFIFNLIYMYVFVWIYGHKCRGSQRPGKGIGSRGAGVTHDGELSNMGCGTQTL